MKMNQWDKSVQARLDKVILAYRQAGIILPKEIFLNQKDYNEIEKIANKHKLVILREKSLLYFQSAIGLIKLSKGEHN